LFIGVDVLANTEVHFMLPQEAEEQMNMNFQSKLLGSFADQVSASLASAGLSEMHNKRRSETEEETPKRTKFNGTGRDSVKSSIRSSLNEIFSNASNGIKQQFPYASRKVESDMNGIKTYYIEFNGVRYNVQGWPDEIDFEKTVDKFVKSEISAMKRALDDNCLKIERVDN
jgi:hypothetical protein